MHKESRANTHTLTIFQVSGEAGAGKTQLGLQLSLQVQLPTECGGLAGHAVYISSEGDVPVGRLKEMAASQQVECAGRVCVHQSYDSNN